jgi:hypothetical protein
VFDEEQDTGYELGSEGKYLSSVASFWSVKVRHIPALQGLGFGKEGFAFSRAFSLIEYRYPMQPVHCFSILLCRFC